MDKARNLKGFKANFTHLKQHLKHKFLNNSKLYKYEYLIETFTWYKFPVDTTYVDREVDV